TLIDIREPDEFARNHIDGAQSLPLSRIAEGMPDVGDGTPVIFYCRSGGRTSAATQTLLQSGALDARILDGGIDAWKRAGLPVMEDKRQPIEIMRQVQITAGSLVLLGVILGFSVHPGFFWLSGFVGAGLTFAGVSGTCAMARILGMMPWNRSLNRRGALPSPQPVA
ncbi:MAG: rhodanese family protein, partial [Pseudomonadota bacterium]